jgi:ankyrin repeat protein
MNDNSLKEQFDELPINYVNPNEEYLYGHNKNKCKGFTELMKYVLCNDLDKVKGYIEERLNRKPTVYSSSQTYTHELRNSINQLNDKKYSALFLAVMNGANLKIIKLLLNNGGDINIVDVCGYTMLIFAAARGYTEIVKLLFDNKVDVNYVDKHKKTALAYAIDNKQVDITKLLIECNADVNAQLCNKSIIQYICDIKNVTQIDDKVYQIIKLIIENKKCTEYKFKDCELMINKIKDEKYWPLIQLYIENEYQLSKCSKFESSAPKIIKYIFGKKDVPHPEIIFKTLNDFCIEKNISRYNW